MNITPNKLSISQLFAASNEQFIVPSYQRRYAWGYYQFAALFDDINMLKEGDGHLFGTIILHANHHTGGLNQPELVDGQQRLTTLVLFLKAFEMVYRKKDKIDKADDIKKMIICKGLDDKIRPKLVLGELDNQDIESLLLDSEIENLTNKKIKEAIENYVEWLLEFDIPELNLCFYKLTNQAVIIRLDVGKAQDAYKLFETINNRGLRLTPTDIIKNFLLGHASKIKEDETLEKVKRLWSTIITNMDEIDTDNFLRQFMCSTLHRKITSSKLVQEFKKYYLNNVEQGELLGEFEYFVEEEEPLEEEESTENSDMEETEDVSEETSNEKFTIVELLQKLELLSSTYRKLTLGIHEEPKINRQIKNLNYIKSKPTFIFLMHFLKDNTYSLSDKQKVLSYFESLMLRRHICERRTSENDDIFSKLVPFLEEGDIIKSIKSHIEENEFFPNDNEFEESFSKHQFKGRLIERAKYVLAQIEYFQRGNTNELMVSSNQEVHLEHIIPQTISTKKSKREYGDWVTYLGSKSLVKHKKYVNYIGNMTLLGEALNIKAYNNPFKNKKGSYKKSSFLITKELAKQNDFKFSHVDKRGKRLTELALKIWKK